MVTWLRSVTVRVCVLGPVEVSTDGGAPVSVGAGQEQVLLVALVMAGQETVSSGRLIDAIWGDEPPTSASAALKALVHRLRRRHGRLLVATAPSGYRLGEDVTTDIHQVRNLLRRGSDAIAGEAPEDAVKALEEAGCLFRGDPPQGLASTTTGVMLEREITDLHGRVKSIRFEARLATGAGDDLVADLETAVDVDPLDERAWARLMIALYRSGRQAAALGAYARARAALVEGAGIEPGPELRSVEQRILDQDPGLIRGLPLAPTAVETEDAARPELPDRASTGRADLGWFHATTALAGRDEQLAAVHAVVEDAVRSPQRRLILISGDAGTGKTRLAGEIATAAAAQGATVLYGACDPGVAAAYRPFAMALDRLSSLHPGVLTGPALPVVAQIAPSLRDRYDLDQPEGTDTDDDHRRHAAYSGLLGDLAGDLGLILVVDDCHWATTPTLALLRHLASDPSPAPVTIIATYRPRDLTDTSPLAATLSDLHRNPRCTPLHLDRLSRADLHDLLTAASGQPIPTELIDRVEDATGGNPYLVVSTLRHLTDADLVVRRNQRWELTPGALDTLPAGIRHLISQQISTLPPVAVTLLQAAAVAGLTFSLDVTATVAGLDPNSALDAIEAAALAGLVHEDGFDRWRWDHDIARSIVSDQLSTTRRVQTHWRTAQALSERPDVDHDDIAHHSIEGLLAAPTLAAGGLLAHAAEAVLRHDPAAALAYTATALDDLDTTGDTHLNTTLLCLRAMATLETVDDVLDPRLVAAATTAEQAALATNDPDLIVRAHTLDDRYPGYLYTLTSDARHIAGCRRALDALPAAAHDHRARILSHLVELHRYATEDPARAEFGRQLIDVLERDVSPTTRDHIQRRLEQGDALYGHSGPDTSQGWRPPDLQFYKVDPHDRHQSTSDEQLLEIVQQAIIAGDLHRADDGVHELLARYDHQDDSLQLTTRICGAVIHSARADLDHLTSDQSWLEAFTSNVRTRALHDEAIRGVTTAIALITETPTRLVDEYAAIADQDQTHPMVRAAYRIAACWLASNTGDHETAQRHLDELIRTNTGLGGTVETTALYADTICRYRPDLAAQCGAHRQLEPLSGKWLFAVGMSLGPVDLYLAKLAHAAGEPHEHHLNAALDASTRADATFWTKRSQQMRASIPDPERS